MLTQLFDKEKPYYVVRDSVGNLYRIAGVSVISDGEIVKIRDESRQSIAAFYRPISVVPNVGQCRHPNAQI